MILTEKIPIKIGAMMVEYYNNLNYKCKMYDVIEIKVKDLPNGSDIKILVKCDICGLEKKLSYRKYTKNILNGNYYSCSKKCSIEKCKKTCSEKYGVKYSFQSEIVKLNIKETCLKKYGVDNYAKTDEYREKFNNTCLERYGAENPFQHGYFKDRSKETCLKKYGVDNYAKTDEYREKFNNTCLERYGAENYMQTKEGKEKVKITRIKNGKQTPDDLLTEFKLYTKLVVNKTHSFEKQLFQNWNGYDYYDGGYIKDNLSLNSNDKLYPTIDHKISIFYGFNNNIPADDIANINNLCITKRSINSSKNKLTEEEFKQS